MSHGIQIVIACNDPLRLTEFWAAALGYVPQPPPEGFESWDDFADAVGIPEEKRNDMGAVVDPDGKARGSCSSATTEASRISGCTSTSTSLMSL